jgi:Uma2 family endonuclease
MAGDAVQTRARATYEDLLRVPDTKVAEIVDGELVVSSRPALPHAHAATAMFKDLLPAFDGDDADPGGWRMFFEPELHFGDDVLVPDLAGWRRERLPAIPNAAALSLPPDWLCEIISPSSVRHDRIAKMRAYARNGAAAVWLVDPIARTLENHRLDDGRWLVVSTHAGDETARIEPFDAIELRLARWWIDAPAA